jgi:hypothetical protein
MGLGEIGEGELDTEARHVYSRQNRGLSFSTDLDIAKSYGNVIVESRLPLCSVNALVITDELAYLVCERQGIPAETQKEVIVLPPFTLNFRIIHHGN